jgi:hypothetical protein
MLEALIDGNALATGVSLRELAERSHKILRRSPELFADVNDKDRIEILTTDKDMRGWQAYWRENPVRAWTGEKRGTRAWFRVEGDRFLPGFHVAPERVATFTEMVREIVDYRLAAYRVRQRLGAASAEGFLCDVSHNDGGNPILFLDRKRNVGLPEGDIDVRLSDGTVWMFRFMKVACNVARPVGTNQNQLPDLLRRWFGPRAGQSGTSSRVRFFASPDGLWVEPVHAADVIPLNRIAAYPDLRAAAGHAGAAAVPVEDEQRIALPFEKNDPDLLAVRVSGTSMDGGDTPMRDGDWAILRVTSEPLQNRVMLLQVAGDADDYGYVLKRLKRVDRNWLLTSDNPDGPTIEATAQMRPIARVERVVPPDQLAPPVGTVLTAEGLGDAFGIDVMPTSGRHEGHLFVFIDREGMLEESDRVRFAPDRRRPGETAYVLAKRDDDRYRYCGVGRYSEDDGLWHLPSVDLATWQKWGGGRDVSRRLPTEAAARAAAAVEAILVLPDRELVQTSGARARIVRAADRGGIRIELSSGGERTISLTDIAWVIVADDQVRERGGLLDEDRVNRLRYLEGTPKASTRWIDTAWAITAWLRVRDLVATERGVGADRRVRRDDGAVLGASFSVEASQGQLTVVYASGGGTRTSEQATNPNYREGLELVIRRLRDAGFVITDALLDSDTVRALSVEQRRLQPAGLKYPLVIEDARAVRIAIMRAAAQTGRKPGAKGGGNPEKRIRLVVARTDSEVWDPRRLGLTLERTT